MLYLEFFISFNVYILVFIYEDHIYKKETFTMPSWLNFQIPSVHLLLLLF